MRKPLSVELQVAISLWVLGSGDSYRTIVHLMSVGKSTVCVTLARFVEAVCELKNIFIKFPTGIELDRVTQGYRHKWGFPNAGGAIDGTHIPIIAPVDSRPDYYNRKGWYSMVLQATVNDRYMFTDAYIGWPGSVHDARIFTNSGIYDKGQSGDLFAGKCVNVNGEELPIVLLADPAYPLMSFLIKPFSDNGRLTPEKQRFNYKLSQSRMTVENAFGRLKGRWRCLLKRLDMQTLDVPNIALACCILHNMCEAEGDSFQNDWLEDVQNADAVNPQPRDIHAAAAHQNGNQIRETLVNFFDRV